MALRALKPISPRIGICNGGIILPDDQRVFGRIRTRVKFLNAGEAQRSLWLGVADRP